MNLTTTALHSTVLHYYTVLYFTLLYFTVLYSTIHYCNTHYYTVLYYTLLYICVQHLTINITIRDGSEWVIFCCSYVFCHKMVTNIWILVFEVSIEPYLGLLLNASI